MSLEYVRFGIVGQVGRHLEVSVFDELAMRLKNRLTYKLDLFMVKTATPIIPRFFMKSAPSLVHAVLTQRPPGGRNDTLCVFKLRKGVFDVS